MPEHEPRRSRSYFARLINIAKDTESKTPDMTPRQYIWSAALFDLQSNKRCCVVSPRLAVVRTKFAVSKIAAPIIFTSEMPPLSGRAHRLGQQLGKRGPPGVGYDKGPWCPVRSNIDARERATQPFPTSLPDPIAFCLRVWAGEPI